MYKLDRIPFDKTEPTSVTRLSDGACIPFDPANTDYQTFKKEILAGAELQDADGNPMTQQQADEFIASLP
jgi:hypothetical protein